jgi:hypothetical protein
MVWRLAEDGVPAVLIPSGMKKARCVCWEKCAAKDADFLMMFNPWADEDAPCLAGTEADDEL